MELTTLVERARQGDATAFGHLVTHHWRFVYTICLSQVGRAAEAEDLTQDVFTRMSRDLTDLRAPDKFLPWLHQVTKNVCRMWRRRQRTTTEPLSTIAEVDDPAAAARLRRSELGEIVQAMLAQLSPSSREVLALHYLAGYSEPELAVACGVSSSTIKSRLHEAREQAKRKLLPIVRELLSLRPQSEKIEEPTMPRYGKAGCPCARVLTDTR
jgi:RNA polymerase sigma factor (sigma-70 family)